MRVILWEDLSRFSGPVGIEAAIRAMFRVIGSIVRDMGAPILMVTVMWRVAGAMSAFGMIDETHDGEELNRVPITGSSNI